MSGKKGGKGEREKGEVERGWEKRYGENILLRVNTFHLERREKGELT